MTIRRQRPSGQALIAFPIALALRVQRQGMAISGASNLLKLPLQQKTSFYDYVCFLDDPQSAELGARVLLI